MTDHLTMTRPHVGSALAGRATHTPAPLGDGARLLSINNYHYRRGGAEFVFLEHNRVFGKHGWDVVPFCMQHPDNEPSPWDSYFVEEIEFGRDYGPLAKAKRAAKVIYSLEARRKLRGLIAQARPQVAHAHNVYHHISPAIFSVLKAENVPTVLTLHDLKLACPAYTMLRANQPCESCRGGKIHNVLRHRCLKGSAALSAVAWAEAMLHASLGTYRDNIDRFVVPSRFYIDKLVEWGWPRARFTHIPNFVDVERFSPQGQPGRGFLYFGRLSPEKGLPTLIRAAAKAGVPLTIVGTGAQEPELRGVAAAARADVTFLGYRSGDALHAAVTAARAVVLPSEWYENAPVSVLEAYALGRPVIGARIGGIPELVREGETGTTFPSRDVDALAGCLTRFAAMPDARVAEMGREGRFWVEHAFTVERYYARVGALYADLMEQRR